MTNSHKLNIYFACSITGGREDEAEYRQIVDFLTTAGHTVPTAVLATSGVVEMEINADAVVVYERDVAWIRGCDVLLAEVTTPSHGVGYEIGYALARQKPVICLHKIGQPVSKMLTGNRDPLLEICAYEQIKSVLGTVKVRLDEIVQSAA
jgi:2'-deoxynucleoside 5'-phosphate N-hydrolase